VAAQVMPRQEQNGNPVLTAKSAWGISQRKGRFPLCGSFHCQLPVASPRVELGIGRFVRKTFPALDLSDSEARFASLVLHSPLLSARPWKRGKISGEAQGWSEPLRQKAATVKV